MKSSWLQSGMILCETKRSEQAGGASHQSGKPLPVPSHASALFPATMRSCGHRSLFSNISLDLRQKGRCYSIPPHLSASSYLLFRECEEKETQRRKGNCPKPQRGKRSAPHIPFASLRLCVDKPRLSYAWHAVPTSKNRKNCICPRSGNQSGKGKFSDPGEIAFGFDV